MYQGSSHRCSNGVHKLTDSKGKHPQSLLPKLVVGASRWVVSILPRVKEVTLLFGQHDTIPVSTFYLNDVMRGNPGRASRLFNIAIHMEGYNMVNLFSVDPRNYKQKRDSPKEYPDGRPWDARVPIFDGIHPFRLTEYVQLLPHYDELAEGDFALVVFTVSGYKNKTSGRNMASLNAQLVIRLTEYNDFDEDEGDEPLASHLVDETALGVDDPTPMKVVVDELVITPSSRRRDKKRISELFTDIIEISSDEGEVPLARRKLRKLSELEALVQKLKRENKEAIQAKNEAERQCAKIEEDMKNLKNQLEASCHKIACSKLDDDLTCDICSLNLWYPYILPECGHIFCRNCINDWFNTIAKEHQHQNPYYHHD
ncbi:uncharacterized protein ARMOST_07503 [Armillaria ostoyae]|uniref:RING-type domain-containing protein n=1 Tax=Armillaria ostoyae TaxID=47428 RepID=A0A284R603_ARMOS|nr:uncharacterized protein ARMOST_07503 [Armillaria ostoyae]